jgi:RNA polymerase sigma factor (TIGR02999 family)
MTEDEADHDVTRLLVRLSAGDETAYDALFPLVYGHLHEIAGQFMRHERDADTLQTTALVNEACIRLLGLRHIAWIDRAHFFRVAARAMRRVLIDQARARTAAKRGADAERVPFDSLERELADYLAYPAFHLLDFDRALQKLAADDERKAQVVELLIFGGLSLDEVSNVIRRSRRTVDRDWQFARLWLIREMEGRA